MEYLKYILIGGGVVWVVAMILYLLSKKKSKTITTNNIVQTENEEEIKFTFTFSLADIKDYSEAQLNEYKVLLQDFVSGNYALPSKFAKQVLNTIDKILPEQTPKIPTPTKISEIDLPISTDIPDFEEDEEKVLIHKNVDYLDAQQIFEEHLKALEIENANSQQKEKSPFKGFSVTKFK